MVNLSFVQRNRWQWFLAALIFPPLVTLLAVELLSGYAHVAEAATTLAPDAPGSISGHVVDDAGTKLADIDVLLYRGEDLYYAHHTATNAAGDYAFFGLGPGIYKVRFFDQQRQFYSEYYDDAVLREDAKELVIAGNQLTGIDATLGLGGVITGSVVITAGYDEYREIALYFHRPAASPLLMEIDQFIRNESLYRFAGLWPGHYYLCARAVFQFDTGGSLEETEKCFDNLLTADPAASTPIAVIAGQTVGPIDFHMSERADRTALVVNLFTPAGVPISDTSVSLYRSDGDGGMEEIRQEYSNRDGIARLPLLEAQPYTLTFSARNGAWLYLGPTLNGGVNAALPVDLSAADLGEGRAQHIAVTMAAAAHITGVVTFDGSAAPISGRVSAYSNQYGSWMEERWAFLDATGHYTLTGLYPKTYRLRVEAQLGDADARTFYGGKQVEDATDIVLTQGEVRRNINWDLSAERFDSVISGTVSAGHVPQSGIRVELWHGHPEGSQLVVYTMTDEAGQYRIEGLPESIYYLRFVDPQQRYAVAYLGNAIVMGGSEGVQTDGTNQLANIDGHLVLGGAIAGTVRRYDGTPVANALVGAHFPPGSDGASNWAQEEIDFRTDVNGEYVLTGLLPGFYRIGFGEEGAYYPSSEFYGGRGNYQTATDVPVEAGQITAGIDLILGPDHYVWLPYLVR